MERGATQTSFKWNLFTFLQWNPFYSETFSSNKFVLINNLKLHHFNDLKFPGFPHRERILQKYFLGDLFVEQSMRGVSGSQALYDGSVLGQACWCECSIWMVDYRGVD